ncbi:hypothetical protein A3Q56_01240 [Intoshia linei]|uniref:Ribosomal protein L7/L12 C-terminal domain-containing protein n=1 Tax=Intoshia linei TaxID=1819745 RepID=A0A177B9T3_9BILA|nr:hypothetical protein A3Q56_01240 [Intoshia linei]
MEAKFTICGKDDQIDSTIKLKSYINFDNLNLTDEYKKSQKSKIDQLMKKSIFNVTYDGQFLPKDMKKPNKKDKLKNKEEKEMKDWFSMKTPFLSFEAKNDLKLLHMRNVLDPKINYKADKTSEIPKHFQIGTIVSSNADFYSSRLTNKQRKPTLAEEILCDFDKKKRLKKKSSEIKYKSIRKQRKPNFVNRNKILKKFTQYVSVKYMSTSEAVKTPDMGEYKDVKDKEFSPKIVQLVDKISKLNLVETCDLNELLKTKLNITDSMIAPQAVMAQTAEKTEEEPIKSAYNVRLVGFIPEKKISIIKAIKILMPELNLVQAKQFIESTPQLIKSDLSKEESDALQQKLETAGGKCHID